jgi:hypothetical protein
LPHDWFGAPPSNSLMTGQAVALRRRSDGIAAEPRSGLIGAIT